MPASEAQLFTSVFIIHRPYFQHPDTNLFWTQDQVYEWFTAPHPAILDNELQSTLHNYLLSIESPNSATQGYLSHLLRPPTWPHHDPNSVRHIQTKVHMNHHQGRKTRLHWLPLPGLTRPMGRIPSSQSTSPTVSTTNNEWPRIFIPTIIIPTFKSR